LNPSSLIFSATSSSSPKPNVNLRSVAAPGRAMRLHLGQDRRRCRNRWHHGAVGRFAHRYPDLQHRGHARFAGADVAGRVSGRHHPARGHGLAARLQNLPPRPGGNHRRPVAELHRSGRALASDAAAVRAGFDIALTPEAVLSLDYDGSFASRVQNNAVRGSLAWRF
jgi:hypothetical protein